MEQTFPLSWSPNGQQLRVEGLTDRGCVVISGDGRLEITMLGAGIAEIRLRPRERAVAPSFDPAHDPSGTARAAWEERARKYGRWIGENVVDYHARLSRMTRLGRPRFTDDEIEGLLLYFEQHDPIPRR